MGSNLAWDTILQCGHGKFSTNMWPTRGKFVQHSHAICCNIAAKLTYISMYSPIYAYTHAYSSKYTFFYAYLCVYA
jgi:hypothetical protein